MDRGGLLFARVRVCESECVRVCVFVRVFANVFVIEWVGGACAEGVKMVYCFCGERRKEKGMELLLLLR